MAQRVLVVDDDPTIRRTLRINLRARGYDVEEVGSGADALSTLEDAPPDLVVLDLGLPDLDGVEVLRRIRARSAVPVVVLSARHQSDDKVEALDEGADDYVTKPPRRGPSRCDEGSASSPGAWSLRTPRLQPVGGMWPYPSTWCRSFASIYCDTPRREEKGCSFLRRVANTCEHQPSPAGTTRRATPPRGQICDFTTSATRGPFSPPNPGRPWPS